MSHSKIRTEKVCLNCGTETPGRFCSACGQQNIEPKQSAWQLIHHFFSDITHFDGKFFETVKDLFAKPGFLSKEYMSGRRASYLDPIRMYIFTSAFFFLVFFSLYNAKRMHIGDDIQRNIQDEPELNELVKNADSVQAAYNGKKTGKPFVKIHDDSAKVEKGLKVKVEKDEFTTFEAYDSAQKTLPVSERDGWIKRKFMNRKIVLSQRYEKEQAGLFREIINNFLHNFPKMLFISLPLFALILKLLYIRRRQFYYVDHGIFSIHLYIFSFLVMLVYFGVDQLQIATNWSWLFWIMGAIAIYPLIYYYKAMRKFYGQSRRKTILKYLLLFMLSFFVQAFIFVAAALFTLFES